MKRLLPFIPILLLFLVNSCAEIPNLAPDLVATAIQETQIALTRAAAPTSTPNPHIPNMIYWLNNELYAVSPLGRTIDAEYHVINVSFPDSPNGSGSIFRVDVGCICMNDLECCLPERTFVVVIEAMYRNSATILWQVPAGINEIMIVCANHQTRTQIGAITAPWQDVDAFLRGHVSGDQLGVRTKRIVAP